MASETDKLYLPTADGVTGGNRLPPAALRRLNRLHAQAEMMQAVAQQMQQTSQQTQQALQQAALAACEDAGITVPQGANLDIDFATGSVKILPGAEGPAVG